MGLAGGRDGRLCVSPEKNLGPVPTLSPDLILLPSSLKLLPFAFLLLEAYVASWRPYLTHTP